MQVMGSAYFQAAGKPLKALILGLSRQFLLLIPLLYLLPPIWGLNGVWDAQPLADAIAFTLTGVLLWREMRLLGRLA
jgi:Na+-driven multidrug efflux pump